MTRNLLQIEAHSGKLTTPQIPIPHYSSGAVLCKPAVANAPTHPPRTPGHATPPAGTPAASNLSFTNAVLRRSRFGKPDRSRSNSSDANVALARPAGSELRPVPTGLPSSSAARRHRGRGQRLACQANKTTTSDKRRL